MSLADHIPPSRFGNPDACHLEAWPRKDATLDDVARVVGNVQWMIRDWLPRGFMTVIFGRPEQGKSGIALQTARHLLFGEPWPEGAPCRVVRAGRRSLRRFDLALFNNWLDKRDEERVRQTLAGERYAHGKLDRENTQTRDGKMGGQGDRR